MEKYPGFGGFFPTSVSIRGVGDFMSIEPDTYDIPALENGQLFWAIYGLTLAVKEKFP